jgi:hypothetical protein
LDAEGKPVAVSMLVNRLTSAALVFSAGNVAAPQPTEETVDEIKRAMPFFEKYDFDEAVSVADVDEKSRLLDTPPADAYADLESPRRRRDSFIRRRQEATRNPYFDIEEDQCRLYYYRFSLSSNRNVITHQFALSAIPFEFPSLHPQREMVNARYIYGCSTSTASFGSALGRAVKIDVLAKMDTKALLARARERPPRSMTGCVDERSVMDIISHNCPNDPIRCFKMPPGWYAQEARFVPRARSAVDPDDANEDDGHLLFYAFDESQLDDEGEAPDRAVSELWILDAKDMTDVVCRIRLPQRVPYGLHGNWFSEEQIARQRPVERFRSIPAMSARRSALEKVRDRVIALLG